MKYFCLYLSVFLLISCDGIFNNDPEEIYEPEPITVGEATKTFPDVDQRLWIYFERFEIAGNERGLNVDLTASNVTGSIEDIASQTAPGLCTFDANETFHHINITLDFWDRADITKREVMVFHELGHCYLDRPHFNLSYPNGFCISLMRDGSGTCDDNYHMDSRADYLDELFGI